MPDDDARVKVLHIAQEVSISWGSVASILQKLHLGDLRTPWVPHEFTPVQEATTMAWWRSVLARFHAGRSNLVWLVWQMECGDESRLFLFSSRPFPLETKQQRSQWTPVGGAPAHKLRSEGGAAKQIFP